MDVDELVRRIEKGDRRGLAAAITLVESTREEDRARAAELLQALSDRMGRSVRVGITGVPGVGKSTLLDSLGSRLLDQGKRVAVLAIDPSSSVSGGSILGDKSRMARLSVAEGAFVHPSPSSGELGGVAARTRESLLLCEAAGYDVVIVETVGVGQSEVAVASMVDTFVLLALPGAGDELQGIKRGVVELADVIAVNKADGANRPRAEVAVRELGAAVRYLRPRIEGWTTPVLSVSATEEIGIGELWSEIERHREHLEGSGNLEKLRGEQAIRWMWDEVGRGLRARLANHPAVRSRLAAIEGEVRSGQRTPNAAAAELLDLGTGSPPRSPRK